MTRVLLVHDIGNIVKAGEPDPSSQREDFVRRYGSNDHAASRQIGAELGLTPAELDLMDAKVFVRNAETVNSSDYTLKVAAYADQRVAPSGVEALMQRLKEAEGRYRDRPGSSMNNPRTPELVQCASEIEKQVLTHADLEANAIHNSAIGPYVATLKSVDLDRL